MTRITRYSLVVIGALLVFMTVLIIRAQSTDPEPSQPTPQRDAGSAATAAAVVRPDSHRLTDVPDSKVTVVEFLDLECEACRAAFPAVERLRDEYGDRVTFVMRYFPIPSHRNAELAARAVEAAAQQGKLEPMYRMMYETQPEWGEQIDSKRALFADFARRIGLDVPRFERDLDDPATTERVLSDRVDGVKLGVLGTPTFFINGARFTGAPTYDRLNATIEDALEE